MPKISIIIPIYNTEKYLVECLNSIINQTLQDIEIICINDGSTDSSQQILDKFSQQDSRIVIIKRKNKGVGYTRNEGIKNAHGDFIAFIDPDDKYPNNTVLENLYTKAVENNVKICGGEFAYFSDKDSTLVKDFDKSFEGYLFEKEGIIKYTDYQFDYGFHRFIYSRDFLIKNKIFYPNYKRFQDPPFFINALNKATLFYAINETTYAYRNNPTTSNWNNRKLKDLLKGLSYNFKFAKKNKLNNLYNLTSTRLLQHKKFFKTKYSLCWFYLTLLKYDCKLLIKIITKEQTLHKKLSKIIIRDEKIMFWGASMFLENFLKNTKLKNKNILGIIDKNETMQGKQFYNYKIYSPEKLPELAPESIILTIQNNNQKIYKEIQDFISDNYPNIRLLDNIFEMEEICKK